MNDDERNVDEQLDEQQRRLDQQRQKPLVENHKNNTRGNAEIGGPAGAKVDTVSESAKGTKATTVTGDQPE